MKVLLALSASGGVCSVAVCPVEGPAPTEIPCITRQTGIDQSAYLLESIEQILSENRCARSDIAAIAFEAGPGSFTSLRIACSVAQGLAFGLGVPVLPIGTLEALAVQSVGRGGAGDHSVLVAVDARMSEIYSALIVVHYDGQSFLGSPQLDVVCRVGPPAQVLEKVLEGRNRDAPVVLVGDAIERYPVVDTLNELGRSWRQAPAADATLRADTLAWIGRERFERSEAVDPSEAAPFYVRDKVALDRTEQAQARAARAEERRVSIHG